MTSAEDLRANRAIDGVSYAERWKQIADSANAKAAEDDDWAFDKSRLRVIPVDDTNAARWKRLVDEYHYVPHSEHSVKSYGRFLRYFVKHDHTTVAAVAFSGSFLSIGDRDDYIGWTKDQRFALNRHIAQNLVYCIFPWARKKNLASAALALVEKRVKADWEARYGDELVLLDTLVESSRYKGTSYLAANWVKVGETKGFGFRAFRKDVKGHGAENMDRAGFEHGIKKTILVRPLVPHWKKILTGTTNPKKFPLIGESVNTSAEWDL